MLFVFTLFIILYGYLKERSSKTLITWNIYLATIAVFIFWLYIAKSQYKKERMNKLLSSIFFDPSHPASFSGPQKLYEAAV